MFLWSRQVAVILSPSLLHDTAQMTNLTRDLARRLSCMAFSGSLVVIDAVGALAVSGVELSTWPEMLQRNEAAVCSVSSEAIVSENWTQLDEAFGCFLRAPLEGEALDEASFHRTFREGAIEIDSCDREDSQFEMNRMDWESPKDETLSSRDTCALVAV